MASILQGLQFYPGDSIIHRLDPRAKLLISTTFLFITLIYVEVTVTTIIVATEAFLAAISGIMRRWIKTVYGSIPFIAAVFLMISHQDAHTRTASDPDDLLRVLRGGL